MNDVSKAVIKGAPQSRKSLHARWMSWMPSARRMEVICATIWPYAACTWLICSAIGGYYALWGSPQDYQQGEMVRFLYLHVPASWLALFLYTLMAILSLIGRIFRVSLCYILAQSIALIGLLMTGISLLTGSLWGKPVWGTYWVWDARLTSMLFLFFMYLGYVSITYGKGRSLNLLHRLSPFVIISWLNIPLIKWSVNMWFTLHQPASFIRLKGVAVDPVFLTAFVWCFAAYLMYTLFVLCIIVRGNIRWYRQSHQRPE